jgi:hypothetical protein
MATIAKLNTQVTGDASGFNSALADVEKRANGSATAMSANFAGLLAVGKNLVKFLLPLGLLFNAIGAANAAVDTYKFARSIGVATSEVEALRQGLKGVGSNADAAESILAGLAQNIAGLGKGNVIFADTLQRIGIDAKHLATLPPPQALEVIAAAIGNIQDKTKQAAIAYQLFGKDAAAIIPLIANGADKLKDASAQANALGLAIKDSRVAQIEDAQKKWEQFGDLIHGIALRFIGELIPYVTAIIDQLPEIGTVAVLVHGYMMTLANAIDFVGGNLLRLVATAKLVKASVAVVFLGLTMLITMQLTDWVKKLIGFLNLIGVAVPNILMKIGVLNDDVMKNFQSAMADAATAAADFASAGLDTAGALARIKENADAAGAAMDNANKAGGALAKVNNNAPLFAKGLEVIREFQTPLQKFNTRMEELNAMLEAGAISWDIYSKATHDAVNQLEKAHELQRMGLSAATQAGTVEAYSSILTSQQQENMSMRETPMERTNRILQDSKEIEKRIAENTEKTAEAIQSITVVQI